MGGRYLLIAAADVLDAVVGERIRSLGFQSIVSDPSLHLLVNDRQTHSMSPDGEAGIIGDLHNRRSSGVESVVAQALSWDALHEHRLLSDYWGSYVSFRQHEQSLTVLRDPSGTLPCFYTVSNGNLYLASDVSLLFSALGRTPAIDWDQLARLLYGNDLPEERTALSGVRELLPGNMLDFGRGKPRTTSVWSPWNHVATGDGPAPAELKQCVCRCVAKVASRFDSLLIGVSGGLDSSIVAVCAAGHSQVQGITISTDDLHGDEAHFALELCDHLGIRLVPKSYRLSTIDIGRSSVGHLPRPGGRAQLQAYDAAVLQVAEQTGADAFLSGVGGDNVFYYTNSARPLVDHYLDRGIGIHLFDTLMDICRLTGCTVRQAIAQARLVPRGAESRKYHWRVDGRFLAKDLLEQLARTPVSHPWLEGPSNCLPGRAAHIAMILRALRYVDGQDRQGSLMFAQPLLAQPIVEMCLSIPSWRATAGGRDRAVARQAFAAHLPSIVAQRRTKGGPDAFAYQIIRANLPEIRERLLHGVLARHRILDLALLASRLHEEHLMRGTDYVRILLLLDTEAWARQWIARAGAL